MAYIMRARYRGRCDKCDGRIRPGDRIVFLPAWFVRPLNPWQKRRGGLTWHAECRPEGLALQRPVPREAQAVFDPGDYDDNDPFLDCEDPDIGDRW